MPTITQFQNGQTLTSSALTVDQINVIFQLLTTQILGIVADLELPCEVLVNSPVITTPIVQANIGASFIVVGNGIPFGTTILSLTAQGESFLITLSNNATATALEDVSFYNSAANTSVRISWQQKGAPAFAITDTTIFLQCVPEAGNYNVRDETWQNVSSDNSILIKNRVYTRQWRVRFVAYGPGAFDSVRLIRSMLLEDFPHDTLALTNLYLVPDTDSPVRNPELFEGQWWERVDYSAVFLEQVNESITITRVASVQVIGTTSNPVENFSITVQGVL